jgi:hypothetical protein
MKPFAHLSFLSAFTLWELLTILLLIGAVSLTFSVAGVRMDSKTALILGVGLFSYFPFRDGLFMGQISCLILFLITAGVLATIEKPHFIIGAEFCRSHDD